MVETMYGDNGFKREDSVRDIGALLDWIETQPDLDIAVYGGSYGGYGSRQHGALRWALSCRHRYCRDF